MIEKRIDEASLNASLDACLDGARKGDPNQARHLHEILDLMLEERSNADGVLWLTDHAKEVLAGMHQRLSLCEGQGDHLKDDILDAVGFIPHQHPWEDSCGFVQNMRIALAVAHELCRSGGQDVPGAAEIVAARGEYDLAPEAIVNIYDEIASTVGGFKEISRCH